MHPMINIAVKAARKAATIINRASFDIEQIKITTKKNNDFVTNVDKAAEKVIIEILSNAYPNHSFLAEESSNTFNKKGTNDYLWIIDPLDGTTNFIHGFPQYAISIALEHKGKIIQSVIFDPNRNELYTASKGEGAYLNDRRLRVSQRINIKDALIGTGFPYSDLSGLEEYLKILKIMTKSSSGIRRPGAASLDLAYVAAGRFDGFYEKNLKPWDMAAGVLLITEAGGIVSDFYGNSNYLNDGNIIAGSPKIFNQMLAIIMGQLK